MFNVYQHIFFNNFIVHFNRSYGVKLEPMETSVAAAHSKQWGNTCSIASASKMTAGM